MIAPNLANAFGIFLLRQFIKGVPDELIAAGRMDDASELQIVFLIVAPSVTPGIAALALFAFVYHWNSYLWPLTVLYVDLSGSARLSRRRDPCPTLHESMGRWRHLIVRRPVLSRRRPWRGSRRLQRQIRVGTKREVLNTCFRPLRSVLFQSHRRERQRSACREPSWRENSIFNGINGLVGATRDR